MSEQDVQDWIGKQIAANDVVLFMKGTSEMPQCGFSMQVAQILGHLGVDYEDINVLDDMSVREGRQGLLKLADGSAALCQRRVCWRLRYRARDVPGWRASGDAEGQGHRQQRADGNSLSASALKHPPHNLRKTRADSDHTGSYPAALK